VLSGSLNYPSYRFHDRVAKYQFVEDISIAAHWIVKDKQALDDVLNDMLRRVWTTHLFRGAEA